MQNSNKKTQETGQAQNVQEKNVEKKINEQPVPNNNNNRWLIIIIFVLLLIIIWGLIFYILSAKGTLSRIFNLQSEKSILENTKAGNLNELQNANATNQIDNLGLATDTTTNNPTSANAGNSGEIEISGNLGQTSTGTGTNTGARTNTGTSTGTGTNSDASAEEETVIEEEVPLDDYDFERTIESIQNSFNSLSPTSAYDSTQLNASELSL